SFADWLTAPDQRGSLHYVSRQRGHERLADMFWKEYQQGGAALSGYGRTYVATHLVEAGRWDDLAKLLCDLRFIEARAARGSTYQLAADYALALAAWPGSERCDPRERPAPAPLPGWLPATTAAVLAGGTVPHPEEGAGPLLAALRALPEDQRNPEPQ